MVQILSGREQHSLPMLLLWPRLSLHPLGHTWETRKFAIVKRMIFRPYRMFWHATSGIPRILLNYRMYTDAFCIEWHLEHRMEVSRTGRKRSFDVIPKNWHISKFTIFPASVDSVSKMDNENMFSDKNWIRISFAIGNFGQIWPYTSCMRSISVWNSSDGYNAWSMHRYRQGDSLIRTKLNCDQNRMLRFLLTVTLRKRLQRLTWLF